jgi:hypothetical protein
MELYSYVSSGGMVLLLLILGAIITYLFFSKGFWLDRFMQDRKWEGQDIEPEYNTNQDIHDAISQENQEGIPYTPSLDIPFEDPEVPNRPSKKKKAIKSKSKQRKQRKKKK